MEGRHTDRLGARCIAGLTSGRIRHLHIAVDVRIYASRDDHKASGYQGSGRRLSYGTLGQKSYLAFANADGQTLCTGRRYHQASFDQQVKHRWPSEVDDRISSPDRVYDSGTEQTVDC
jgi:hypothetical protein